MSYRPLLELGEGGMAKIVLALATGPGGFNKLVVLKVMRSGQDTSEIRRLLLAEARLSARLNHPNVVQVHEVVEADDAPYLVMEYLDGRPLSALRVGDVFTPSMLMTVISEALVGLHHAHELKDFDGTPLDIVHRDVSPHNVFLTYDGVVKVLDFGIAKTHQESSHTETGEVKGKIAYMPPEQLLGEPVDRRADIFAIGGMLWEAATGVRMWANVSQANLMHRLVSGDIPRPSEVAQLDPELEQIIVKATSAKSEDRYETALAMQQALDAYLERTGQRAALRDIGATLANTYQSDRQARAAAIKEALRHNSIPPPPSAALDSVTGTTASLESTTKWPRAALIAVLVLSALLVAVVVALRSARQAQSTAAEASATTSAEATSATLPAEIPGATRPMASASGAQASDTAGSSAPTSAPRPAEERAVPEQTSRRKLPASAVSAASAKPRSALPPPASEPASARENCDPPYYFDHGIKTYKPQCL